jgi:hypothetical protein
MSDESNSKDLKKRDVNEESVENKGQLSSNIQLLNDRFNTICSNYFKSFSDIQTECGEIIENNIKANKKFREKWMSDKSENYDILERYLKLLVDQLNDSTDTLVKINEINNKFNYISLNVLNDYLSSYSKIFVANHDLCKKIAKNWLSFYTRNTL